MVKMVKAKINGLEFSFSHEEFFTKVMTKNSPDFFIEILSL